MTKVEDLVNRCIALAHGLGAEVLHKDSTNTLWLKYTYKELEIFCETYVSQGVLEVRVRERGGKSFLFDVYGSFQSTGTFTARGFEMKVVTYRQGNWENRIPNLPKR